MSSPSDARALARNRAQTHFKSSEQREDAIRAEIEKERSAVETKTAKLRALRLAKEAEERADATRRDAETLAKKSQAKPAKKARKSG